jgi:hypothetical protein
MAVCRAKGRGHTRALGVLLVAAATLALSGCGGQGDAVKPPPGPPTSFGPGVSVGPLPGSEGASTASRLPAVLDRGTAYLADANGVRVVNTGTGQTITTIYPQHLPMGTSGAALTGPPLLTSMGGASAVVWPFLVKGPDGGNAVELASIRTGTHAASSVLVGLPGWAATSYDLSAVAVGAADGKVLLNVAGGLYRAAVVADAGTGKPVWTRDDFTAGALSDGTVVGTEADPEPANTQHVIGLALADGQPRWRQLHGYGFKVMSAGPKLVAVSGGVPGGADQGSFRVLSSANGATVSTLPISNDLTSQCLYDQVSVTVCYAPAGADEAGAPVMAAVDAQTGAPLWTQGGVDSAATPAPRVTEVWHGLVYASTSGDTTVVLQARSGNPAGESQSRAPLLVDDQTALAPSPLGNELMARKPAASQ